LGTVWEGKHSEAVVTVWEGKQSQAVDYELFLLLLDIQVTVTMEPLSKDPLFQEFPSGKTVHFGEQVMQIH